jgi:hypothetical protein
MVRHPRYTPGVLALFLAGVLAAAAGYAQSTGTRPDVAVVIDAHASAADPARAATLRAQTLDAIEAGGRTVFLELGVDRIVEVAADSSPAFRQTVFAHRRPTYGGISLSVTEATEILRRNEAVRDAVIARECAGSAARDCGGAVHAAAVALAADTEADTAAKLERLTETAISTRPRVLVLVTAGWPYRDDGRVDVDAAARTFRTAGTALVVLREPAVSSPGGTTKDAAERLAARLGAPVVTRDNADDVARARGLLAAQLPVRTDAAPAAGRATRSPAPVSAPTSNADDALLDLAAAYVAQFEQTFAAVVWRERYEQEYRATRRFNASGGSFMTVVDRRVLDSELLFVWLPADGSWITVRDVIAVDGRARADRRLPSLLNRSVSPGELRALARENGRFNIGNIVRTFNEPTLPLLFLDERHRRNFSFTRDGAEDVAGRAAVRFQFVERGRPTVIQQDARDLPAAGSIWIEKDTGRVLIATVGLADAAGQLRGAFTVRYGPHPRFDVLVPLDMQERYTSRSGEEITGAAAYSEFRRFETGTRLIVPK